MRTTARCRQGAASAEGAPQNTEPRQDSDLRHGSVQFKGGALRQSIAQRPDNASYQGNEPRR